MGRKRSRLREQILAVMEEPLPNGVHIIEWRVGAIRDRIIEKYHVNVNKSTIKSMLFRMEKEGLVKKAEGKRGFYMLPKYEYAVTEHGQKYPVPPLEIHGVKFELDLEKLESSSICNQTNTGSNLRNRNLSDFIKDAFRQQYSIIPSRTHPKNHSEYKKIPHELNGRTIWITVTLHKKLIEVWIKSSTDPLTFPEFLEMTGWLIGVFPCTSADDWKVTEMGLNQDNDLLKIDGIRSMTLQETKSLIFRIYYKRERGATRKEVHYAKERDRSPTLQDAVETLMGYSPEMIKRTIEKVIAEKTKDMVREVTTELGNKIELGGMEQLKDSLMKIGNIEDELKKQKEEIMAQIDGLNKNDNMLAVGIAKLLDIMADLKMGELQKLKEVKEEINKLKERDEGMDGYA